MKIINDGKDTAISVCPHCKKDVQISKKDWEALKAHLIQKDKRVSLHWAMALQKELEEDRSRVILTRDEALELLKILEGRIC